jgi:DivIVA domain-containing protein
VVWVWVVVIVALTGGVVAVAVGRGGSLSEVYDDRPDAAVPSGRPLTSDDLRAVRFSTAVRGYRMDEVDAFVDRIRADLIARESIPPDEGVRVQLSTEANDSSPSADATGPQTRAADAGSGDDESEDVADAGSAKPGAERG